MIARTTEKVISIIILMLRKESVKNSYGMDVVAMEIDFTASTNAEKLAVKQLTLNTVRLRQPFLASNFVVNRKLLG